jgi:uncharacterized protein
MPWREKYQQLQNQLKGFGSVAVAFSGGVDSTLLLKLAADTLGPANVLAVTLISPLIPTEQSKHCCQLAKQLGVRQEQIETQKLEPVELVNNSPQRCYYCKKHLYRQLLEIQLNAGVKILIEGSNVDDLTDYRPGRKAVEELHISSPLLECGFTKEDIRSLSRHLGLSTWDKPAMACLASRVPYGTKLSRDLLQRIDNCEYWLQQQGFPLARVRCHGQLVRIEIPPEQFARLLDPDRQRELLHVFTKNGFDYITLDLQGYRRGSMNESLTKAEKEQQ